MELLKVITTVVFVVLVALLVYPRMINWFDGLRSREYSRQVKTMFYDIWNGEECDRFTAWERTITSLEAFDYPPEMAIEARLQFMAEVKNTAKVIWEACTDDRVHRHVKSGERTIQVTELHPTNLHRN